MYLKVPIVSIRNGFTVKSSTVAGLQIFLELVVFSYVWTSFGILILLTVAYVIIILNFQRSPDSHNRGSIHSERKLSATLFIVTVLSVLTILPCAIYNCLSVDEQRELSRKLRCLRYSFFLDHTKHFHLAA